MSFEEMVVALVGATGAFVLVGYLSAKVFDLVKTWINRKKGGVPEDEFNRLAKAFVSYKKESQRRIQNLEAIIAGEDPVHEPDEPQQIEASKKTIEIREQQTEEKKSGSGNGSNLRNMLRE